MTTTDEKTTQDGLGRPTQPPPEIVTGAEAGNGGVTAPTRTAPSVAEAAVADSGPALDRPPTAAAAAGDQAVAATWLSGQVTALWSIDEVRNAWMLVAGVGWKKIYNGRDGAFQALVAIASQARQTGRSINFREEADGMVYEIYLW
jgi:hypothetical protein